MSFGSTGRFLDDERFKKVEPIERNLPHKVSEVICCRCHKRWVATRTETTLLKELECVSCGKGYVIETGEWI